jgi:hypothetical protein
MRSKFPPFLEMDLVRTIRYAGCTSVAQQGAARIFQNQDQMRKLDEGVGRPGSSVSGKDSLADIDIGAVIGLLPKGQPPHSVRNYEKRKYR